MKKNPIDQILDPNDTDPVVLYDDKDNGIEFEQICLVPLKKQLYCILRPTKPMKGLDADEALVFQIYTDKEREDTLLLITDSKLMDEVFNVYYELLNKERNK